MYGAFRARVSLNWANKRSRLWFLYCDFYLDHNFVHNSHLLQSLIQIWPSSAPPRAQVRLSCCHYSHMMNLADLWPAMLISKREEACNMCNWFKNIYVFTGCRDPGGHFHKTELDGDRKGRCKDGPHERIVIEIGICHLCRRWWRWHMKRLWFFALLGRFCIRGALFWIRRLYLKRGWGHEWMLNFKGCLGLYFFCKSRDSILWSNVFYCLYSAYITSKLSYFVIQLHAVF